MSFASRPLIATLERIGSTFLNRISALLARDLHDMLGYLSSPRSVVAQLTAQPRKIVLDGLKVAAQPTPTMSVAVDPGIGGAVLSGSVGVVGSPAFTSEDSNWQLINNRAGNAAVVINASDATQDRWDLIEIGPSDNDDVSQVSDFWSASLLKFVPGGSAGAVVRHGEGTVFYTPGTLGGTLPSPTPGRVQLAAVRVRHTATVINPEDVFDLRPMLSDYVALGRGNHTSELRTSRFDVIVPQSGTTIDTAIDVDARVEGIPCSVRTDVPFNMRYFGATITEFWDRNAVTAIAGATAPAWAYVYLVAADDHGYRMSRALVTSSADLLAGNYSHAGLLVFSFVAPSLTHGSLAPSSAIALPPLVGNGTCSPVTGRAVCIGMVPFAAGGTSLLYGVRGNGGKVRVISPNGPAVAIAFGSVGVNYTAESVTGNVGISAIYADWPASTVMPAAPLTYDMRFGNITRANGTTTNTANGVFSFYENKIGSSSVDRHVKDEEFSTSTVGGISVSVFTVDGFATGREPSERGTTKSGFYLQCTIFYNTVFSGHGLSDPSSFTPVVAVNGWEWPQGPVLAN